MLVELTEKELKLIKKVLTEANMSLADKIANAKAYNNNPVKTEEEPTSVKQVNNKNDLDLHADDPNTERKDVMKKILDYLKKTYGIVPTDSGSDKDVMWKYFLNNCCIRVVKKVPYGSRKNAKAEFIVFAEPNTNMIDDGDAWYDRKLNGLTAKDVADAFVVWYKKMQIAKDPELRKRWQLLYNTYDEYLEWDDHCELVGLKKELPCTEKPATPKYTNLHRYEQDLYDAITARGIDPEIAMDYCHDLDNDFMRDHQDIEALADEVALEYGKD